MGLAMISPAQKRKIYAAAREAGMDNEMLHSTVKSRYKKEHISDLTLNQAGQLIELIESSKGGRSLQLPTGRSVPLASDAQLYKIGQLARQLGWENPQRLRGFCKKYAGVDNPDWMTKEQAWRIIEGLKSLVKQTKTKGGGNNGARDSAHGIMDEGN